VRESRRTGAIVVSLKEGEACAQGKHVSVVGENHLVDSWVRMPSKKVDQPRNGQEMGIRGGGVNNNKMLYRKATRRRRILLG